MLAEEYENEIKNIKDNLYRMAWFMRGSVQYIDLLYDTDIEDQEIMNKLIKTNIENTKNSKMPLL